VRVLVTGHRGYIGSVLTAVLRHARFDVVGLDCQLYGDCGFGRVADGTPSFDLDIREIEFTDLLSFDAVIHLAGLPEHFHGEFDDATIEEVNLQGTLRLAECCKQAQVGRFVFASSCAVYGRNPGDLQTEESLAQPITPYARCKLECERLLAQLADTTFAPVLLRLGTIYGVSPRLRLDTVVNDFVASAVTRARIDLKTDGRAWRPLIHVEDAARAFASALTAPDPAVRNQIINVAATEQNIRIIDLADLIAEIVPGTTRSAPPALFDARSYRVDGSKLGRQFPHLQLRWSLAQGIRQLRDAISASALSPSLWRSDRFRRVMRLQSLVERGELSPRLFRQLPESIQGKP
jgi:nucleoside-diphosphate-sugar epimerase